MYTLSQNQKECSVSILISGESSYLTEVQAAHSKQILKPAAHIYNHRSWQGGLLETNVISILQIESVGLKYKDNSSKSCPT